MLKSKSSILVLFVALLGSNQLLGMGALIRRAPALAGTIRQQALRTAPKAAAAVASRRLAHRALATQASQNAPSDAQGQYACKACLTAGFCPTFNKGMDLAKLQPKGQVDREWTREFINDQAKDSGKAALLTGVISSGALATAVALSSPVVAGVGLVSAACIATFAKRAWGALHYSNQAWWEANKLRRDISIRRLNLANFGLGLLDAVLYGSEAIDSSNHPAKRILDGVIAYCTGSIAVDAHKDKNPLRKEQVETCLAAQAKFDDIEAKLKEEAAVQEVGNNGSK